MPVRYSRNPVKPNLPNIIDRTHPLAKRLENFWLFNEGGGTVISDLCRRNPGTLDTTVTTWSRDFYGKGLVTAAVSSSNKGVTVGGPTISYGNNWTWDALIRYDGSDSYGCLFANNTQDGMFTRSSGALSIYFSGDHLSTLTMTPGQYYHILVTANDLASTIDIYFNGVHDSTISITGCNMLANTMFNDTSNETFQGCCFYMRVWSRWMDSREATKVFQNPFAMIKKPTVILTSAGSSGGGIAGRFMKNQVIGGGIYVS